MCIRDRHLTVTQFKVQAEQQRLEAVTGQVAQAEQNLEDEMCIRDRKYGKRTSFSRNGSNLDITALAGYDLSGKV